MINFISMWRKLLNVPIFLWNCLFWLFATAFTYIANAVCDWAPGRVLIRSVTLMAYVVYANVKFLDVVEEVKVRWPTLQDYLVPHQRIPTVFLGKTLIVLLLMLLQILLEPICFGAFDLLITIVEWILGVVQAPTNTGVAPQPIALGGAQGPVGGGDSTRGNGDLVPQQADGTQQGPDGSGIQSTNGTQLDPAGVGIGPQVQEAAGEFTPRRSSRKKSSVVPLASRQPIKR